MAENTDALNGSLAEARQTIARLTAQVEALERRQVASSLAESLAAAFKVAAATSTMAAPVSHSQLLELIVATAAEVINARAAALFLLDRPRQELTFEVALGQKADEVRKFRVPVGTGIAGMVAATGQPMAISDAQHDPRHASQIAETTGYRPQSILCVPMVDNERVIGVLELLDKQGAPSFGPSDMRALSLFANQAAVAISQSQLQSKLGRVLADALVSAAGAGSGNEHTLQARAQALAAEVEDDPAYERALQLASLVHEIAERGPAETRLCEAVLRDIADYTRLRARPPEEAELVGW